MTRHCHNYGEPWTISGNPGRAELVQEKAVGNFCEYFEFARRKWIPKEVQNSREDAAREHLKKLLGD